MEDHVSNGNASIDFNLNPVVAVVNSNNNQTNGLSKSIASESNNVSDETLLDRRECISDSVNVDSVHEVFHENIQPDLDKICDGKNMESKRISDGIPNSSPKVFHEDIQQGLDQSCDESLRNMESERVADAGLDKSLEVIPPETPNKSFLHNKSCEEASKSVENKKPSVDITGNNKNPSVDITGNKNPLVNVTGEDLEKSVNISCEEVSGRMGNKYRSDDVLNKPSEISHNDIHKDLNQSLYSDHRFNETPEDIYRGSGVSMDGESTPLLAINPLFNFPETNPESVSIEIPDDGDSRSHELSNGNCQNKDRECSSDSQATVDHPLLCQSNNKEQKQPTLETNSMLTHSKPVAKSRDSQIDKLADLDMQDDGEMGGEISLAPHLHALLLASHAPKTKSGSCVPPLFERAANTWWNPK